MQAGNRRLLDIEDAVKRNQSRIGLLDEQIASIAAETGPLSVLLSQLLAHIHGEECPVCGRDYSDVSTEPLASHVAKRVAELSDQAQRLRALTTERSELSTDLGSLIHERETIDTQARREGPALEVQDRLAKIRDLLARLRGLQVAALEGTRLLSAETQARQAVAQVRDISVEERDLRSSLAELAKFLGLSPRRRPKMWMRPWTVSGPRLTKEKDGSKRASNRVGLRSKSLAKSITIIGMPTPGAQGSNNLSKIERA